MKNYCLAYFKQNWVLVNVEKRLILHKISGVWCDLMVELQISKVNKQEAWHA